MTIINPKKIVKEKIVRCNRSKRRSVRVKMNQRQPNSIDLTLKKAMLITGGILRKEGKTEDATQVDPTNNLYFFTKGNCYDILFNEYVEVPEDMVGFIIARSSLNRIGAFITSGLYDSGFKNYIGAVLRTNADVHVEKGARIATIFFCKAESAHKYLGQYQGK